MASLIDPETFAYFAYSMLVWGLRFGLIIYILPRHRASEAIAWIAVTLIHPMLGIPLYLFFGRPVMGRAGVKLHDQAREMVDDRLPRPPAAADRFDQIAPTHRDLARLAETLGRHELQLGNRVDFLSTSEAFIDLLVREIESATVSVHLLYYIYLDDRISTRVTEALRSAAKRGVHTRLLVDAVGSRGFLERVAPSLRASGVSVRAALPVRLFRGKLARIDVRNHRKVAVIDDRIAITGSHNLCDPSYGQTKVGSWHDLSARIEGPAVDELQRVFLQDWIAEGDPTPSIWSKLGAQLPAQPTLPERVPVLVAPAGPGHANQAFRDLVVSAINEANHRLVLTTPYFVPDESALLALRLRAQAGVDVQIVVPRQTNSALVNAASRPAMEFALEAGARVHLHRDGLLHSKTLTVDDSFAVVGSGNFDRRSFDLNYELNFIVFGDEVTRSLRATQEKYIAGSDELTLTELHQRSYAGRLVDAAANVVAPLL